MGAQCQTACCGEQENAELDEQLMVPRVSVLVVGLVDWPEDLWYPAVDRSVFCTACESGSTGEVILNTQRAKNLAEPLWNEEFSVSTWPGLIEFRLWEEGVEGRANILAKAFLDLATVGEPYIYSTELPMEASGPSIGCRLAVKVRPEDGDFPENDPISCFGATIQNPRKKALGLEVDPHDGISLYVTGVKAGSVLHTYNKGVSSDVSVTEGCYIVGVNGVSGKSVDLDKALKKSTKVAKAELVVCPAFGFHLAIQTDAKGSLGMVCPKRPLGRSLLITSIATGGPLDSWNEECPEQAVVIGDRIVAVNGKGGKAAELLKMITGASKSRRVVLSFSRKATNSTSVTKMPKDGWRAKDKSVIPEMQEGAFSG